MSKKGENIYKRKDNRWEGRYQKEKDVYGRVTLGYVYGRTYHEAKEKLREAKANALSLPGAAASQPFSHLCTQWLQNVSATVRQSTYVRYKGLLENHILNSLGHLPVSKITPPLLNQFLLDKLENGRKDGKGGLSVKSVQDIYTVLKSILRYGELKYGIRVLEHQPFSFPKREKKVAVIPEPNRYLLEQYLRLDPGDFRKTGLLLCLYTGLRIGEICALRWRDIDFSQKVVRISRTLQRIPNPLSHSQTPAQKTNRTLLIEASPKTSHSIREIPLPSFLWEHLAPLCPRDEPDAYFLTGCARRRIEPRNYQYFFQRILRSLGIAPVNFHCLRHTFATRCIEVGFDVKTLSEILGHSDVNITLNHYVHSSIQMKRMQMELLAI